MCGTEITEVEDDVVMKCQGGAGLFRNYAPLITSVSHQVSAQYDIVIVDVQVLVCVVSKGLES